MVLAPFKLSSLVYASIAKVIMVKNQVGKILVRNYQNATKIKCVLCQPARMHQPQRFMPPCSPQDNPPRRRILPFPAGFRRIVGNQKVRRSHPSRHAMRGHPKMRPRQMHRRTYHDQFLPRRSALRDLIDLRLRVYTFPELQCIFRVYPQYQRRLRRHFRLRLPTPKIGSG